MLKSALNINVTEWVEKANDDPVAYLQRQATEITLNAIAMNTALNDKLFLKGGVLMGLAYNSPRQTGDIDLTADIVVSNEVGDEISKQLNASFPAAAAHLGYANLILKVHSMKRQPRIFEAAEFPALKLKIVYVERGSKQEKAFHDGKATNIIDVDISFNEPTQNIQILNLTNGYELHAYSLSDLIAEKYRAMLQQVTRDRIRRQDVYDLKILLDDQKIDHDIQKSILDALIEKCQSRHIEPDQESLNDPEVKRRSGAEWDTMALEIGELPDFEKCFQQVSEFYNALPWDT